MVNKICVSLILLACSAFAHADIALLRDGGYVGCKSLDSLHEFIEAAQNNDGNSMDDMLVQNKCAVLSSNYGLVRILEQDAHVTKFGLNRGGVDFQLFTINEAVQRM